jgi:hypothetical protein
MSRLPAVTFPQGRVRLSVSGPPFLLDAVLWSASPLPGPDPDPEDDPPEENPAEDDPTPDDMPLELPPNDDPPWEMPDQMGMAG